MPFVVHPVGDTPTTSNYYDFPVFSSQALAAAERPAHHKVTYIESVDERRNWTRREAKRFGDGAYRAVPWPQWTREYNAALNDCPEHRTTYGPATTFYHYAHRSQKEPGMIAYTPDTAHGVQDRQVITTPGRYLEKFFIGHSDPATRRGWGELCAAVDSLQIARTPDEVERVYRGKALRTVPFRSCMGPDLHACFDDPHPVIAYGDSDLGIAYLGPIDAALARAVVWPDRKLYGRLYGEGSLKYTLEDHGFTNGSLEGARIRALRHPSHNGWIMPYVDHLSKGRRDGEWIVLGTKGSIGVQVTCGWSGSRCQNCSNPHIGDGNYCDACVPHACAACAGEFCGSGLYSVRAGGEVCSACADLASTCEVCGDSWCEVGLTRAIQTRRITPRFAGRVCEACAPETRICHSCDLPQNDNGRACEDCGIVERCTRTLPLPLDGSWLYAAIPAQGARV